MQSRLGDASEPFGGVLDKALDALSRHNRSLAHVPDHIRFMRTRGSRRIVSDGVCRDLVRHFSRYRLGNDDFQFSDVLGAACQSLVRRLAEWAGKRGGDFHTPRDVIQLLVRIANPQPEMSVYDPACRLGAALISSREFIEQSGGDPTRLRVCGQADDASVWSICKLHMLLHGIPGADIQLGDALLHPRHREGSELERFDRVIAHPPIGRNYTRSKMEFPERFRWGWCPATGRRADLMFAQHMLAVCQPGGMVATVMPQGVLCRGGAEKEIRRKFLEQDLIEAVIGLPPNLFSAAGIRACILVLRPNLTGQTPNPNKPEARRGQVLFIRADAESDAGSTRDCLRPEHIEKIISSYDQFVDVANYARRVPLDEIGGRANDCNLDIGRYINTSQLPAPPVTRASLLGGVPAGEVQAKRELFDAVGFDPSRVFVAGSRLDRAALSQNAESVVRSPESPASSDVDSDFDFSPFLADRTAVRPLVEHDPGVQARGQAARETLGAWWQACSPRLVDLPAQRDWSAVRAESLESFVAALMPLGMLDRCQLVGLFTAWWDDAIPEFKTLREHGFPGVVDGWVDAVAAAMEEDNAAGPAFDPFRHIVVCRTMPDYLGRIAGAQADVARPQAEKKTFEAQNRPEDKADEANWNYAKCLEQRLRQLTAENRAALEEVHRLGKAALEAHATDADRQAVAEAKARLKPAFDQMAAIASELVPYEQIKDRLAEAYRRYGELVATFVADLQARCAALTDSDKQALVLESLAQDVQARVEAAVREKQQQLVEFLEGLWDKYRVTLDDLRRLRGVLDARIGELVARLGYE
jgi:type I restriction enzyme M protein